LSASLRPLLPLTRTCAPATPLATQRRSDLAFLCTRRLVHAGSWYACTHPRSSARTHSSRLTNFLQRAAAHNTTLIQPTLSRPRAVTTMHLPRILPLVPLQAAAILPNCVWSEIWRAGRRPGCCPYLRSAARPLTPSMVARLFLPSRKSRRVQRTARDAPLRSLLTAEYASIDVAGVVERPRTASGDPY
jgi:hypothetical protein